MEDTFLDNIQNAFRGRLLSAFLSVGAALGVGLSDDLRAGDVSPLYATKMASGEQIKPMRFAGTSVAWVIGEEEPLYAEGNSKQGINDPLDQQFYTSSLVKPLVYMAVIRKMESDNVDVLKGAMDADDALTYDSVLVISERAKSLSSHRSFENEVTVREALPLMLSFSLNDVTYAVAERIANGSIVSSDISSRDSQNLEKKFVLEYMRPIAKDLGMDDTFLVNATGLPTYSNKKKVIPTWFNNVSTPRDMMAMFNHILQKHPQYIELSSHVEVTLPNKKDPFKDSNPLLEGSTRGEDDIVQAISTEGVGGGKTGLSDVSLWNAMLYYDLSYEGGEGYVGVFTTGNGNDEYALGPKEVLDKGVELWRVQHLDLQNMAQLGYCPVPDDELKL